MNKQTTNNVFIIRPANFGYNTETAESNAFQNKVEVSQQELNAKVNYEFTHFARTLAERGINVNIFNDTATPIKPDAIFPNNWISMHQDGTVVLYPMFTPNRRIERRLDILDKIKEQFNVKKIIDLSDYENKGKFLEGTGSIVFDHLNKIAYACLSPRTHKEVLDDLCKQIGYKAIVFEALDLNDKQIYHTNVMMCVGLGFVVICMDSIKNKAKNKLVRESFSKNQLEIIEITHDQMNKFAGNMLLLNGKEKRNYLCMSESAFLSLTDTQKEKIKRYAEITPLPIPTIESIGGGSARCMIAEIFLEEK